MPLTQEQFQSARNAGFSTEQIIEFEKRRIVEQPQLPQQPIQQQPQIPQQLQTKPSYYEAAIKPFISEVISPAAHFGSALAADIPETIARRYFPQIMPPEQQTVIGKLARGVGEAMGFGRGLPGMAAKGATGLATRFIPKLAGKTILPSIARGAIGGAAGMGAITPKEGLLAPKERGKQAGIGAIFGSIAGALQSSIINKWLKPKNQLALTEEARNSLVGQKNQMVEGFGKQYQSIMKEAQGKTISLRDAFNGLLENTDDAINTIQGQTDFNQALAQGNPTAKKLLNLLKTFQNNPQVIMENISVEEADTLQKFIKQMPGIQGKLQRAYKYGFEQVDWTNAERIMLDFANDIKANVLDLAPELKMLNQNYGQFMTNYKQIRPYLKWNRGISTILNIHQPQNLPVLDLLQKTLPQNLIQNILQMNRTLRNAELLKRIGVIAGAGTLGGISGRIGWEVFKKK